MNTYQRVFQNIFKLTGSTYLAKEEAIRRAREEVQEKVGLKHFSSYI